MISANIPSESIINDYGLAVWLVVVFVLGLMLTTYLLVRHLLKTHEKERQDHLEERKGHQEFFSSAIKSNTEALVRTAETLSEASNNIRHSMDALARVEQIALGVKDDYQEINATQMEVQRDIGVLTNKIDGFKNLQRQCQEICKKKMGD